MQHEEDEEDEEEEEEQEAEEDEDPSFRLQPAAIAHPANLPIIHSPHRLREETVWEMTMLTWLDCGRELINRTTTRRAEESQRATSGTPPVQRQRKTAQTA